MTERKYSVAGIAPRIDGFLQPILRNAGFEVGYQVRDAEPATDDFETPDVVVTFTGADVDQLLANRAELLLALEHITMEMLRVPSEDHSRISFDANDYRLLRIEELRLSATTAADKVKRTGQPFRFNPITLNPLRYTNVVMSIVFPVVALLLGGIGLPGGAVYINHAMLRSKSWDSLVSVAGPVANALFAIVIGAIVTAGLHLHWLTLANAPFFEALAFLGYVEVIAVILNLLPIPPLDGFGILRPWLPYSVQSAALRIGMAGYVILFFLFWYVPAFGSALFGVASQVTVGLGIDPTLVSFGYQHMRFR